MNTNTDSKSQVPQPDDTFWIRMIVIFAIVIGINCLALLITWLIFWQNRRKRLLVQAARIVTVIKSREESKATDNDMVLALRDRQPIPINYHAREEDIITSTSSPKSPVILAKDRKPIDTKRRTLSRPHGMPSSYPLTPTVIVIGKAAQESPPMPRNIRPKRDLESSDKFISSEEVGRKQLQTIAENEVLNIPTTGKAIAINNSPTIEVVEKQPTNDNEARPQSKMRRRAALTMDTLFEKPDVDKTERKLLFRNKKLRTSKRKSLSRRIRDVFKKKNESSSPRDPQTWRTVVLRGRKL